MNDDNIEYKDVNYMKKNKKLCIYCSYRCAVPSKLDLYCSEMCRLLHLTITEEINIKDIAKLIKLSKVELIDIILSLKCQDIDFNDLNILLLNKPFIEKQKGLHIKNEGGKVNFD